MDLKKNLISVITSLLVKVGKDFLAAVAPELYAAYQEWDEERKTPDGLTEREYLTWLSGSIGRIRAKQIGGKWADYVGDIALQSLQMRINRRIDELDEVEEPPVVEDPTDPHPPARPVEKDYYGTMFTERPKAADYNTAEDQVWWNKAIDPVAVRYTITSTAAAMAWPGWVRTTWG